jgi:uncharacterized protein YndB with AHSA1/START domain
MTDQSYSTTLTVDRSPAEVYAAVTDVRAWWSEEVEGPTDRVGSAFRYRGHDEADTVEHLATIRVEELVPGRRVVWRVLDNHFSFTDDQTEWTDTVIRFDITGTDAGTELRFTHEGLLPAHECFPACSTAWTFYVTESLRGLLATGRGAPITPGARVPSDDGERVGRV